MNANKKQDYFPMLNAANAKNFKWIFITLNNRKKCAYVYFYLSSCQNGCLLFFYNII